MLLPERINLLHFVYAKLNVVVVDVDIRKYIGCKMHFIVEEFFL